MINEEWYIKEQMEIQKILSKSKSNSKIFKESESLKEQYGLSLETEKICVILKFIGYSKQRNKYLKKEELINIINDEKYFEIVDILAIKLKELKEEELFSKEFLNFEVKLYSIIMNEDFIDNDRFIIWKEHFQNEKKVASSILEKFSYVLFLLEKDINKDIENNFDSRINILNIDSSKLKKFFEEFTKNEKNRFRIKCFNIEIKNQYEDFDEIIIEDFNKEKSGLIDLISIHPTLNFIYKLISLYEDLDSENLNIKSGNNLEGLVSLIKKEKGLNINF